jgi:hypothetical protein
MSEVYHVYISSLNEDTSMSDKHHTQGEHGNGRVDPSHNTHGATHGNDKARIDLENEKWKESQEAKEKEQEEIDPEVKE